MTNRNDTNALDRPDNPHMATSSGGWKPGPGGLFDKWIACLVMIMAVQFVPGSVVAQDRIKLQKIKERAFRASLSVTSFDLSARIESSNGAIWQVRFLRDRQKYRIDRTDVEFAVEDGRRIVAPYSSWSFDGEIYQSYNARNGALKLSEKGQAKGAADPALLPFRWVTSILCTSDSTEIENPETWNHCFAKARYKGTTLIDGDCCEVVEFDQECFGEACLFKVFFSAAHDGFPIRYERRVKRTGQLSTVFSVLQWVEIKPANETQTIRFPIKMTRHENGKDGVSLPMKRTVSVQADIRINGPVDPAVYDLEKHFDIESVYRVPRRRTETRKRPGDGG